MPGPAVTVVASGGIPVTPVTSGAPPLTLKPSGGIAITIATQSAPFVVEGYVAFLGSGAVIANTSTTSITPALPAAMRAGDIIVVQALCLGSNTAFTTPTGYTLIADFNVGAHRVGWWWKRHTGTETAQAVINTGRTATNLLAGQVTARRGCIGAGTPYEALNTLPQPVSGPLIGVGVTTLGVNRLAENNFMALGSNTAYTSSGTWIENLDQGTSGGGGGRFYAATSVTPTAAVVPADTLTGTSALYGAIGLAWKAA